MNSIIATSKILFGLENYKSCKNIIKSIFEKKDLWEVVYLVLKYVKSL